jgi:DNA-binding response OmpR family regulator
MPQNTRTQDPPYPYILLLTSKEAKQDLVEGLDAGADDYLIKPIDLNELQARLRVGRRILNFTPPVIAQRTRTAQRSAP